MDYDEITELWMELIRVSVHQCRQAAKLESERRDWRRESRKAGGSYCADYVGAVRFFRDTHGPFSILCRHYDLPLAKIRAEALRGITLDADACWNCKRPLDAALEREACERCGDLVKLDLKLERHRKKRESDALIRAALRRARAA